MMAALEVNSLEQKTNQVIISKIKQISKNKRPTQQRLVKYFQHRIKLQKNDPKPK